MELYSGASVQTNKPLVDNKTKIRKSVIHRAAFFRKNMGVANTGLRLANTRLGHSISAIRHV